MNFKHILAAIILLFGFSAIAALLAAQRQPAALQSYRRVITRK